MTTTTFTPPLQAERFARAVARRLDAGAVGLPYDVSERLRAARSQAVASRKKASSMRLVPAVSGAAGSATLTFGDDGFGWLGRIASVLPLVALVAGLVLIHTVQNERRASELAEVDAALLTDDLPPAAYADPGFVQFLKSGRD